MGTRPSRKHYRSLADGELFSVNGWTWYACAVPLFGNVAVYVSERRDGCAPTVRVSVPDNELVYVTEVT